MILSGVCATVWADEKQTCQEQLMISKAGAYNLDQDRDKKEELLAKEQITVYMLRQHIAQLQKTIDELKKAAEPKGDEKPKE